MRKLTPRLISDLAHMAIKQSKILHTEGLSREARLLAGYGRALALSSLQASPPRLVPVKVKR